MAVWTFGPLLGPAIGPVLGGYVTETLGWRWVFWIVAILVSLHDAPPARVRARRHLTMAYESGGLLDHHLLRCRPRILCANITSAQGQSPSTGDGERKPRLGVSIWPESKGACHPIPATASHHALLLADCFPPIGVHCRRLRLPISALRDHTAGLWRHIRLFPQSSWSRISWDRNGSLDWQCTVWTNLRPYPAEQIKGRGDETRISTSLDGSGSILHPCVLLHLRMDDTLPRPLGRANTLNFTARHWGEHVIGRSSILCGLLIHAVPHVLELVMLTSACADDNPGVFS